MVIVQGPDPEMLAVPGLHELVPLPLPSAIVV